MEDCDVVCTNAPIQYWMISKASYADYILMPSDVCMDGKLEDVLDYNKYIWWRTLHLSVTGICLKSLINSSNKYRHRYTCPLKCSSLFFLTNAGTAGLFVSLPYLFLRDYSCFLILFSHLCGAGTKFGEPKEKEKKKRRKSCCVLEVVLYVQSSILNEEWQRNKR